MSTIWDEKTLKIAKIIVAVLVSVAASLTTLVTSLAALGVDVSTLIIFMTVVDALAAAVAAFFGIKKTQVIEAQKEEIASLKAAGITKVKTGSSVTLDETETEMAGRIVERGNLYVATCDEPTCNCKFKYRSKHIVQFGSGTPGVQCPECKKVVSVPTYVPYTED